MVTHGIRSCYSAPRRHMEKYTDKGHQSVKLLI